MTNAEYEPIDRMTKDLRVAARTLSDAEVRYLVDAYYLMQENRIRADGQVRSMGEEPHGVLVWLADQNRTLEDQVKVSLDAYTGSHPVGEWMREVKGIGPVIAAGLLAHIDIEKAPTVGHIWNFAGLNPDVEWSKGQKRPWNARLKTLCWKAGESFVKVSGRDDAFYGKLYAERKEQETAKNDAGEFAGQAAAKLEKVRIGKTTDAFKHYSGGKLPPAHVHARAKRYAVKRFLADLHTVWHWIHYGTLPPKPYVIEHGGHAHWEVSRSFDNMPDLVEALRAAGAR